MKNYYDILGVNKLASKEVIDKAYRALVIKYHPDKQEGKARIYCETKMKEINEAYEVLSNEFLREQYDAELEKEEMLRYRESFSNRQVEENPIPEMQKQVVDADRTYKIGTFSAVRELAREVFENRPHFQGLPSKKGWIAILLTAVIIIILGIILWFIPFTNGFMRELIFENPLFSWMF